MRAAHLARTRGWRSRWVEARRVRREEAWTGVRALVKIRARAAEMASAGMEEFDVAGLVDKDMRSLRRGEMEGVGGGGGGGGPV
jgi:hypothetical protein